MSCRRVERALSLALSWRLLERFSKAFIARGERLSISFSLVEFCLEYVFMIILSGEIVLVPRSKTEGSERGIYLGSVVRCPVKEVIGGVRHLGDLPYKRAIHGGRLA